MAWIWKYFLLIFSCIGAVNALVGYYIGCFEYQSTDITYYKMQWGFVEQTLLGNNNDRLCMKLCHPYYQYAGTEGKYCNCLNSLIGQEVGTKMCNTPCPNQNNSYNRLCGGQLKMSVYGIHLFADIMSTKTSNQISNQHVTDITATSSKEIAVTDTNYMTASNATTEVPTFSTINNVQNDVSEPDVTDTDYMTAPNITTAVASFSTQRSTLRITVTLSAVTNGPPHYSDDTNYTIIMILATGAFVLVSLFATVKLITFVRKRCSNTDGSIRDEDGQLYLRPVYVATPNDRLDGKPSATDTHSELYEDIEL